jgi:hypothetical protein
MSDYSGDFDDNAVNWEELSALYRIAPLGEKPPADLATVFSNNMFMCLIRDGDRLVGPGRLWLSALIAHTSPISPSTQIIRVSV